ncbi:STAS domain-containing protein [Streptomyces chartreusis]|uniref:STAS domain-containing protein n=1 Tax=Streptomyces TaxID=1883 RepID=UPI002E815526|nr:STAS domain-containing protein [Streptomyces chartreusis]WUB23070.1 STAS domain-containing protein [Streptomyces chartreusis]
MADDAWTGTEQAGQPGELSVVAAVDGGIRVVTVTGEIDQQTGEPLRHALDMSTPPGPRVVVDMSGVSFMDSTGINILIAAHQSLAEAGGWLRLAAITEPVQRTIQLVGLHTYIDSRKTLDQALHN